MREIEDRAVAAYDARKRRLHFREQLVFLHIFGDLCPREYTRPVLRIGMRTTTIPQRCAHGGEVGHVLPSGQTMRCVALGRVQVARCATAGGESTQGRFARHGGGDTKGGDVEEGRDVGDGDRIGGHVFREHGD